MNGFAQIQDLDEAIVVGREAISLHPQGHPDRSESLENLARYLRSWFTRSGQQKDKDELLSLYAQLVHVTQTMSSADLSAARSWVNAAEDLQHSTLLLAYETSLRLLVQHLATPVITPTSCHPEKLDFIVCRGRFLSVSS